LQFLKGTYNLSIMKLKKLYAGTYQYTAMLSIDGKMQEITGDIYSLKPDGINQWYYNINIEDQYLPILEGRAETLRQAKDWILCPLKYVEGLGYCVS